MDREESIRNWRQEIESLKRELEERGKSLPAHSIRPHQLQGIEELEEKIRALEEKIRGAA